MKKDYKIMVNWSNAGNAFIADVPELSGCIADGASFSEALDNVKLAIEEWIEYARISGRPVPPPGNNLTYSHL